MSEFRMWLALMLANIALSIAPKDHPEAKIMARHWVAWLSEVQGDMERRYPWLRKLP